MSRIPFKAGAIIINPYVRPVMPNGKPNPKYKTMVLSAGVKFVETLGYDGKIYRFDVISGVKGLGSWYQDGVIDICDLIEEKCKDINEKQLSEEFKNPGGEANGCD